MYRILSFFLLLSLVYTPVYAVFGNQFYPGLDRHLLRKAQLLRDSISTQQKLIEKSPGGGGKVDPLLLKEAAMLRALSPCALTAGERRLQTLYLQSSYCPLGSTDMLPHFAAIHVASDHETIIAPSTPITALFQALFPVDAVNFLPNHCYKDPIGELKPQQLGTLIRFLTMGYFTLSPSDRIGRICEILGVSQKPKEAPTYIKLCQITPEVFSTAETFVALRKFAKDQNELWLNQEYSGLKIGKIIESIKSSPTPLSTHLTLVYVREFELSASFSNVENILDAVDAEVFRKVHPESSMLQGEHPEIFRLRGSAKKNLEKSIGDLKRRRMAILLDKAMLFHSLDPSNEPLVQQILATFFGRKFNKEEDLIGFYSALLGEEKPLDRACMQAIDAITFVPLLAQVTKNPLSFFKLAPHEKSYITWRTHLDLRDQVLFQSKARVRGASFPDCVETGLRNAFLEFLMKAKEETGESYFSLDRIPKGSPARLYFDVFSTLEDVCKESSLSNEENARNRWAFDLSKIPGVTYNKKSIGAEIQSGALSVLNALAHMLGLEELDPLAFNPCDIPAQKAAFSSHLKVISSTLSTDNDVIEIAMVEEFFPNFKRRDYSTKLLITINGIPCSKIHVDHGHTKLTKESAHSSPLVCAVLQTVKNEEQALVVAPLVVSLESLKSVSSFVTRPSMPTFMNTVDHKNLDMVNHLAVMCLQHWDLEIQEQLYRHLRFLEQLNDDDQSPIVAEAVADKIKNEDLTLEQVEKILRAHNRLLGTVDFSPILSKEPYRSLVQDIHPSCFSHFKLSNAEEIHFYTLFRKVRTFTFSMHFLQNFQDPLIRLLQNTRAENLKLTKITNPDEAVFNFLNHLPVSIDTLYLDISSVDGNNLNSLATSVTQFLARPDTTVKFRFDFDDDDFDFDAIRAGCYEHSTFTLTEKLYQSIRDLPNIKDLIKLNGFLDKNQLLFEYINESLRKFKQGNIGFRFTYGIPDDISDIMERLNQRHLGRIELFPTVDSEGIIDGMSTISNHRKKAAHKAAYLEHFQPTMEKALALGGFSEDKFSFTL